jgi:hypothetical protein
MRIRRIICLLFALALLAAIAPSQVCAQVLVDNPFISPTTNWVDAFPQRLGNWRLSLHNPTLMDTNNLNPPTPDSAAITNTGVYEPDVLIKDSFTAPAAYVYSARMRTNDDDIIGLVWNYQDPNNYFRVGIRQQAAGSFGGTQGLSIQKIVGGVLTQLLPATQMAGPASPITQAMIDGRTPFDLQVIVNGTNYEVAFNGMSVASGSDAALVAGRKVGIQSWAQQVDVDTVTPSWGTEVETVSVTQGANTLFSESFAARQIPFRQVVMTNAAGAAGNNGTNPRSILGNFGQAINSPWIHQHSNGFLNATVSNTDVIGPAVVVDQPGATSMKDYEMRVRIGTADNDGMGVIVRAQDDNNFYRILFHSDPVAIGTTRPPRGMSVQKVRNGVWSELYRDDQNAIPFLPANGIASENPTTPGFPMFDLSVKAVGNTLRVQVRDQGGNVINYPLITDSTNPLLTGTVGFATWGNENTYYLSYGGTAGPLLTLIPEPSTAALIAIACMGLFGVRRRNPTGSGVLKPYSI